MAKHAHWASMLKTMNERRKNEELCDFEIRVGGETFKVHRLVVDTGSPYFRTMFASGMLESSQGFCELHDLTPRAVRICIDLMYTGELELEQTTVANVLKVSHMWQLDTAVARCEDFLKQNIDLSSCVAFINLATLYGLKDLNAKCNQIILENVEEVSKLDNLGQLSLEEIINLLQSSENYNDHTYKLWMFCCTWNGLADSANESLLCAIVLEFPMETLRLWEFNMFVWQNCHVMSCNNCKNHATRKHLDALGKKKYICLSGEDSLFLKKVSKTFGYPHLGKKADEYIIRNRYKVFTCKDFLEMDKEDLLELLEQIDDECSVKEFSAIIQWLKRNEKRHETFSQIFQHIENPSVKTVGKFLSSFSNIAKLATHAKKEQDDNFENNSENSTAVQEHKAGSDTESSDTESSDTESSDTESSDTESSYTKTLSWWPNDVFFVKSLAQTFGCKIMQAKIDKCIVRDFSEVCEQNAFKCLSVSEILKYLSTSEIYRSGEDVIWNAVERWIEHDADSRTEEFSLLFEAMRFDKFSTKFIREKIVTSILIKDSKSCVSHLWTILLQRIEKLEQTDRDHEKRLRKVEKRLEASKK